MKHFPQGKRFFLVQNEFCISVFFRRRKNVHFLKCFFLGEKMEFQILMQQLVKIDFQDEKNYFQNVLRILKKEVCAQWFSKVEFLHNRIRGGEF